MKVKINNLNKLLGILFPGQCMMNFYTWYIVSGRLKISAKFGATALSKHINGENKSQSPAENNSIVAGNVSYYKMNLLQKEKL